MRRPGRSPEAAPAENREWPFQLAFLALHFVLAGVIARGSSLAVWHGRAALGIGLLLAVVSKRPVFAAYAAAYITGAEVFWRMKKAALPWEFGKYALVFVLVVALARVGSLRRSALPLLYFALLLPSTLLTLMELPAAEARSELSFNISGPLALAVCAAFFGTVAVSRSEVRNILICVLAPVLSIAAVGAQALRSSSVEFIGTSNALASGGYGPNQVSAMLGLGIVAIMLYLILGPTNVVMVSCLIGLMLFLLRQCILTFSRGGLYMALGAAAGAAFFLFSDSRHRWRVLAIGAVVATLFLYLVLPRIEAITGGAARDRFSSLDTTGRTLLIQADLKTWSENPVLGIGPGLGGKNRLKVFRVPTAHTEWTRLLAEHGILGLVAAGLLLLMAANNVRNAPTSRDKAAVVALIAYSFLHLTVDATRLAAPSFAFGLSCFTLIRTRVRTVAVPAAAATSRSLVASRRSA